MLTSTYASGIQSLGQMEEDSISIFYLFEAIIMFIFHNGLVQIKFFLLNNLLSSYCASSLLGAPDRQTSGLRA